MNHSDSVPPDGERCVTESYGSILIEFTDSDPSVVHDLTSANPEGFIRSRPTALLEEYLEAGYFNEDTAHLVREELERRKQGPPAG
jgi:hypothetical protein